VNVSWCDAGAGGAPASTPLSTSAAAASATRRSLALACGGSRRYGPCVRFRLARRYALVRRPPLVRVPLASVPVAATAATASVAQWARAAGDVSPTSSATSHVPASARHVSAHLLCSPAVGRGVPALLPGCCRSSVCRRPWHRATPTLRHRTQRVAPRRCVAPQGGDMSPATRAGFAARGSAEAFSATRLPVAPLPVLPLATAASCGLAAPQCCSSPSPAWRTRQRAAGARVCAHVRSARCGSLGSPQKSHQFEEAPKNHAKCHKMSATRLRSLLWCRLQARRVGCAVFLEKTFRPRVPGFPDALGRFGHDRN